VRATAFQGDADIDALHAFFQPETQFDGDTLWSFGTSLKSAYVNSFEFMNEAPVVQLWRNAANEICAVSRISLGSGHWFHLAVPGYRNDEVVKELITRADAAFELLSDHDGWETVRYESKAGEIESLERAGYVRVDISEVFLTRSLVEPIGSAPCPGDIEVALLDPRNTGQVHERAMAQVDAFTGGKANAAEKAWISRSLPHQLSYGRPDSVPSVIAVDAAGVVVAFADPFCDQENKIGEFEPVGTRTSMQGRGLSKVVLTRGLQEMQQRGMNQAVVRTGFDNSAAIAAYRSVGFEVSDHLVRYRRERQPS